MIDPYNDLISEGGKVWDRMKVVAATTARVPNMAAVLGAVRTAEIRVSDALHAPGITRRGELRSEVDPPRTPAQRQPSDSPPS